MNSKQSARLRAIVAVLAILTSEKNKALWAGKPPLVKAIAELAAFVASISRCVEKQEAKDGAVAEKKQALDELGDTAYEVATATKAWASENGNKSIAGRMDFSRSEITKGRDSSVLARCESIHTSADEVVDELEDHEVTPAKLKALEKKVEAFRQTQSKPRQALVTGVVATKELSKLFGQVSELLTQRLDGMMVGFKTTQPELFGEYQSARVVVQASSRAKAGDNAVSASDALPKTKAA